jgi:predicted Zn finger-like uncharacterized protein
MIITCPSCSARYPVDASTFAPSGRKVRCAKCGNTWHQAPPSDLGGSGEPSAEAVSPASKDKAADEAVAFSTPPNQKPLFNSGAAKAAPAKPVDVPKSADASDAGSGGSEKTVSDDDDIAFADEPSSAAGAASTARTYDAAGTQAGTGSKLRGYLNDVASMRRGRVFGAIGWVALVAFVAGTLYGVVEYRREVAMLWPSTVKLYEAAGAPINLVGFELAQVSYERQDENGLPVLAIKGVVVNVSGEVKAVPRLRVGLFDDKQQELYHWTFSLKESELQPDQKAPFVTRLSSPPSGARDLEVRFVNPGEDLPVASVVPAAEKTAPSGEHVSSPDSGALEQLVPVAPVDQTLDVPAQSSEDASSEHHP